MRGSSSPPVLMDSKNPELPTRPWHRVIPPASLQTSTLSLAPPAKPRVASLSSWWPRHPASSESRERSRRPSLALPISLRQPVILSPGFFSLHRRSGFGVVADVGSQGSRRDRGQKIFTHGHGLLSRVSLGWRRGWPVDFCKLQRANLEEWHVLAV